MTDTNPTLSEIRMMQGTSSGYSYIAFAKVGDVALGIKPNMIADGSNLGIPNTTYIGARIRSAPWSTVQEAQNEDQKASEGNVVQFQAGKKDLGLVDTWPNITFEKTPNGSGTRNRASTQVGVFLRGTLENNPELLHEQMDGKKLAIKMADYLTELAGGPENLIISPRQLRDWLDTVFAGHVKAIDDHIAKAAKQKLIDAEVAAAIDQNIGNFGMQAQLLKSIHAKYNTAEEAADLDASGDVDGDGEDNEDELEGQTHDGDD